MLNFGTVSSSLQSVDSHGFWGGLTDGLPSTLGSARSKFERDRTSLSCPPYAALTSVLGQENLQKEVELIARNSEADSQTKYTIYEYQYR